MISTLDIAWAAGFLEGEGCFSSINRNPCITAVQKQREPLERLQALFGGRLGSFVRRTGAGAGNYYPRWQVSGKRAVAIQMTIFALMSPRRQAQILVALEKWKAPITRKRNAASTNRRP